MSKHFVDIAASIVEHGLVRRGRAKPSRVWHIDPTTGKRTLLADNSTESFQADKEGHDVRGNKTTRESHSA